MSEPVEEWSVTRRYIVRGPGIVADMGEEAFQRLKAAVNLADSCEACRAFDAAAEEYHEREKAESLAEIAELEQGGWICRMCGDRKPYIEPYGTRRQLYCPKCNEWRSESTFQLVERREHAQIQQAGPVTAREGG